MKNALIVIFIITSFAYGQTKEFILNEVKEIRNGKQGKSYSLRELQEIKPIIEGKGRSKDYRACFAAFNEKNVVYKDSNGDEFFKNRSLRYLDSFYVYAEKNERLLLAICNVDEYEEPELERFFGWVPSQYLIRDRGLSLKDINNEKDQADNVYYKVIVKTPIEKERRTYKKPLARIGKDTSSKTLNPLFFYYVFGIFTQITSHGVEKFYLVSDKYDTTLNSLEDILLGWINAKYLQEWNSVQAIEIDKTYINDRINTSSPVQFYRSKEELQAIVDKWKTTEDGRDIVPISQENISVHQDWPLDWMRYPILDKAVLKSSVIPNLKAYKVALLSQKRINSEDLEKIRKEEIQRINLLKQVDIIFVIDATGSMKTWVPSLKKIINQIAKELRGSNTLSNGDNILGSLSPADLNIKFKLATYKDYVDKEEAFVCNDRFYDISSPRGQQNFIYELSNIRWGGGNDALEAPFYALKKILTNRNKYFRKGSQQVIMLFGDAGNHRDDSIKVNDVKRLLIGRGNKEKVKFYETSFYALHCAEHYEKQKEQDHQKLFREQMLDLVPDEKKYSASYGDYFKGEDKQLVLRQALKSMLISMKKDIANQLDQLLYKNTGTRRLPVMREKAEFRYNQTFDSEEERKQAKEILDSISFRTGWVLSYDPHNVNLLGASFSFSEKNKKILTRGYIPEQMEKYFSLSSFAKIERQSKNSWIVVDSNRHFLIKRHKKELKVYQLQPNVKIKLLFEKSQLEEQQYFYIFTLRNLDVFSHKSVGRKIRDSFLRRMCAEFNQEYESKYSRLSLSELIKIGGFLPLPTGILNKSFDELKLIPGRKLKADLKENIRGLENLIQNKNFLGNHSQSHFWQHPNNGVKEYLWFYVYNLN